MALPPANELDPHPSQSLALRDHLYVVLFEAETPIGKLFDVVLLWMIIASVFTVALESVASVALEFGTTLRVLEWVYTVVFTFEYALRIYVARRRLRYVLSFFGIIDLLALLPTYLSLIFTGVHSLIVIRALRLLRVFRVLKAMRLLGEAHSLLRSVRRSLPKISVFVGVVLVVALVVGSAMYLIEGEAAGFTSIPRGMYWAIVTMTTVGYGDIAPATEFGQFLAAVLMILGYGILAVPTGIVSAEMVVGPTKGPEPEPEPDAVHGAVCHHCGATGHLPDANFCYVCGSAVD
ncbi:MAG: ion transporter [Deltaproteobacteria bacterium]|nr:ion transporter [Deltaproteobacteria bacterium]